MNKRVILLSGKRFSGKNSVCNILFDYCNKINKSYDTTSFSYTLKKIFCEKNKLDLNKFINCHEYKNLYINELTSYYKSTNPIIYANAIHEFINNSDKDVIIIDDLRILLHLEFMKNNFGNIIIIRVNSTDTSKSDRGWTRTEYDNEVCENELDNYEYFDYIIDNNSSLEELKEKISENIQKIIN